MRSIAFVDDNTLFRTTLARMIENHFPDTVVRQYANGKDFVDRLPLEYYEPALVLMDVPMPVMNGYDATKWFVQRYPHVPVMILSVIKKEEAIIRLLKLGVSGYVSKHRELADLLEGISKVMNGYTYYKIGSGYYVIDGALYRNTRKVLCSADPLTPKEEKILGMIGQAKSYEEIARQLHVDPRTIETHKTNISRKLGCKTRHELAYYAVQMGLVFILSN